MIENYDKTISAIQVYAWSVYSGFLFVYSWTCRGEELIGGFLLVRRITWCFNFRYNYIRLESSDILYWCYSGTTLWTNNCSFKFNNRIMYIHKTKVENIYFKQCFNYLFFSLCLLLNTSVQVLLQKVHNLSFIKLHIT